MYSIDVLRVDVQTDPSGGLSNLIPDPNGMLGGAGFVVTSVATTARIEGIGVVLPGTTQQVPALRYIPSVGKSNYVASETHPIAPGQWAAARVDMVGIVSSAARLTLAFADAAGTSLGSFASSYATGPTTLAVGPTQAPAGTATVVIGVTHAANTSGGIIAAPGASMTLRAFTLATASTSAALVGLPVLPEPWVDVTGGTITANVPRRELGTSVLDLQMMDADLDPATSTLIRPGRRVRILAKSADRAGGWDQLFGGKMLRGTGTYDYLADEGKRVRVAITAVDTCQALAAAQRPDGVATIEDLPAVLTGSGVLWKVNGRTRAPMFNTPIVSRNDNASALDQVAITRDSRMGYAWVDRYGVLQVNDADKMPTAAVATLDEAVYGAVGLEFDYDTDRCINSVALKYLRLNPDTGDSEEVTYGPYVDQASVAEWGPHHVDITVHGLAEDAGALQTYADAILTANATPSLVVVGLQIPIREPSDISNSRALLDMYDLVTVTNAVAGYSETQRITSITHEIGPEKWTVKIGFSAESSIATPIATTPPPAATPTTLGQLLRPVGEVTMWYGTKGAIPASWLALDGSTFSAAAYPALAAHLGSTTLPDMSDRLPIGAGSKALGTTGGSPTKTLVAANLPPHSHSATTSSDGTHGHQLNFTGPGNSGANISRGVAGDPLTSNSAAVNVGGAHNHAITVGNGPGTSTPLDVMPPWRALWFIIRAR